jgi:glycosyltransferase involved in cell wall biosynthesis
MSQNCVPTASRPNSPLQVFIPVYNDIVYFARALDSVRKQQDVDVEVIISDNASIDGSYEYAREIADSDSRVVVHRNTNNIGHTANLNRFADYVTADYYMLLCSDDVLGSPMALKRASDILAHNIEVVSVYSDMLYVDGNDRKLMGRRFGRSGFFDPRATLRDSILSLRNLFGIPLLNRRSACLDLRYPEDLNYVGDIYFSARAAERGRVFHIAEPLIWNRFTGKNLTRTLLSDSRSQFARLAELLNEPLSDVDLVRQAFARGLVGPGRQLFLRWAAWRSSGSVPASRGASRANGQVSA